MIYLELFLGLLKVGCFSFGGAYAAIPLIRDVVLSYGWMNEETLTYMIAISESTPGPIMVNLATYIGTSQAGILGAIVATFAVVLPAFLIIVIVTSFLSKAIENKYVQAVIQGVKPSVIGIILVTGFWMVMKNLFEQPFSKINGRAVIITLILGTLYFGQNIWKKKIISPIMLIVIAALLGVIGYTI